MSGWHRVLGELVCAWIQSKKALVFGGTRVHVEQRVIMLHPVDFRTLHKTLTQEGRRGGEHRNKRW